ncbi:MAG: Peroxide operon regulator [Anaerolineales bacterium]|nr:Peroxide operon regulator [Anaerolineales bacterium]HQU35140.1 Fur family transcriptional regulator [Anaerolineales bacterium]
MSCGLAYAPQLRSLGYRITPQRMAILHVLCHSGKHLSPRDVYQKAKKDLPTLTEPTVYRTLDFLAKNGLARPTQAGKGRLRYEMAKDEHHHLVCRVCGDEIEVEHELLESMYRKMESTSGYQRIDRHVTFFGVCPECLKT